jgi:hypothetical protein
MYPCIRSPRKHSDECPDSEVRKHLRRARTNFGIDKDTGKSILVVPLLNPKSASEHSANLCEVRVRGTSVADGSRGQHLLAADRLKMAAARDSAGRI